MAEREKNLDALRALGAFMVVLVHVAHGFLLDNADRPNMYFNAGNLFVSISCTCVVLFVMLSGAFLLSNPTNRDFSTFYKKRFSKIIVPTLLWSLFYCIYNLTLIFIKSRLGEYVDGSDYLTPFINWILGVPHYHLWYLYMIIGMYLAVPVIIRVIDDIGEASTFRLGWILMFAGIILDITCKLFWPIMFLKYLGYFVLGYTLKKYFDENPQKPWKYFLGYVISAGSIFTMDAFMFRTNWSVNGFFEFLTETGLYANGNDYRAYFYTNLSPFVAVGGICLYVAFVNIKNMRMDLCKIADNSLNIYIIHPIVYQVVGIILYRILGLRPNPFLYIPAMSMLVFTLSYFGSLAIIGFSGWRMKNFKSNKPFKNETYKT